MSCLGTRVLKIRAALKADDLLRIFAFPWLASLHDDATIV